jgi:hypothetical protein
MPEVCCEICDSKGASPGWLVKGAAFKEKARLALCQRCQVALGLAVETSAGLIPVGEAAARPWWISLSIVFCFGGIGIGSAFGMPPYLVLSMLSMWVGATTCAFMAGGSKSPEVEVVSEGPPERSLQEIVADPPKLRLAREKAGELRRARVLRGESRGYDTAHEKKISSTMRAIKNLPGVQIDRVNQHVSRWNRIETFEGILVDPQAAWKRLSAPPPDVQKFMDAVVADTPAPTFEVCVRCQVRLQPIESRWCSPCRHHEELCSRAGFC